MDVVPLTVDAPPAHQDAWAALVRALYEEEIPELEPPDRRAALAKLVTDDDLEAAALLALEDDRPVGALLARLPQREDLHCADLELYVAPAARRTGVARRLVAAAADRLCRQDRCVLRGAAVAGQAGEGFAATLGAREAIRVVRSRLDLTEVRPNELAAYADRVVPGYRLLCWGDRCPDELVDRFARARTAMNDAPVGDSSRGPWTWDAARVRRREAQQHRRGYRALATAVLHEHSGELAGFTQLFCTGVDPRGVEQEDTAVVAAHRGHGLGLLLKAVNLRRLLVAEPRTRWVVTWNAADNRFMRAVNEQLGFVPCAEEIELELSVG